MVGPLERLRFDDIIFRHIGANQNAIDGVLFEAEMGSHDGLVAQNGLYYVIWRQQIGERTTGLSTVGV